MNIPKNYDMYMGNDGSMYLYVNSKYFWVNKPGSEESRARKNLPNKGTVSYTLFGSLRKIANEATEELGITPKEPEDLLAAFMRVHTLIEEDEIPF